MSGLFNAGTESHASRTDNLGAGEALCNLQ